MKNFWEFGLGFLIWTAILLWLIEPLAFHFIGRGVFHGGGGGSLPLPIGGPVPVTGKFNGNKLIKTQLVK